MKALNHSQIWIAMMAAIGSYGMNHQTDGLYVLWVFFLTLFVYNGYRWLKIQLGKVNSHRLDHVWSIDHKHWHQIVAITCCLISCLLLMWIDLNKLHNIRIGSFLLALYILMIFGLRGTTFRPHLNSFIKALILSLTWSFVLQPHADVFDSNFQWFKMTYIVLFLFGLALSFELRDQANIKPTMLALSIISLASACAIQGYFNSYHLILIIAFYVFAILLIVRQSRDTQNVHFAWPIDGLIGLFGLLHLVIT